MSTMMIYALKGTVGGTTENVWGYDMQVRAIDSSDKDAVDKAKADGWTNKAQDVIEQAEAKAMQKDNDKMKGQLSSSADKKRIKELEQKLAVYEESKDVNGDGVVSYDEMTIAELGTLLTQRKVEHNKRDGKDALIKAAQKSE